jgi:hypothetical protein
MKKFRLIEVQKDNVCEHCGSKDASYRINPYDLEMYDEEHWEWICDECIDNLKGDV